MHNNYRVILRVIAGILLFEGVAMFIPLVYAIAINDASASAFFLPALLCLCIGLVIHTQLQCLKKLKEQNTLNLKPYLIKLNFLLAVEKTLENFTGLWAYYRHQLSLH